MHSPSQAQPPDEDSVQALSARVPEALAGRRFDAVIAELFPEFSRSRLSIWIKSGDALLDGRSVRGRDPVRGGEIVTLAVVLDTQTHAEPEDIALDVLYEDDQVFVLDKPAGLVVHPGAGNPTGTLVNALLHRDPTLAALPRAGIVHRTRTPRASWSWRARCRPIPRWSRSFPRAASTGNTWPWWSARWCPAVPRPGRSIAIPATGVAATPAASTWASA